VSGPHDFAVRLSAIRQRRIRVHRIPFRVRDDREPPLLWNETAQFIQVIWVFGKSEYFSSEGWTLILPEVQLICPSSKIPVSFEIVDHHRG
jgi:hypothetical protein